MAVTKKIVRQTLVKVLPLSFTIKNKDIDREIMDKRIFIEIMNSLRKIEDRRDFMEAEIGMDMTAYEDEFFQVIENLFKLSFSKPQLALIQMYLYQLVPDKDWDGTITIEINKEEKSVNFKTPEDVWAVIKKFEE